MCVCVFFALVCCDLLFVVRGPRGGGSRALGFDLRLRRVSFFFWFLWPVLVWGFRAKDLGVLNGACYQKSCLCSVFVSG